MKIKPFGDQILVSPIEDKRVLGERSLCEYGEVIAVGADVKYIKPGDKIGFLVWGLNSLKIDDEKFYFVQETPEFVLGTVEM